MIDLARDDFGLPVRLLDLHNPDCDHDWDVEDEYGHFVEEEYWPEGHPKRGQIVAEVQGVGSVGRGSDMCGGAE